MSIMTSKLEESVARYHRLNTALGKLWKCDLEKLTLEDCRNHFEQLDYLRKQIEQVEKTILVLSIEKFTEV